LRDFPTTIASCWNGGDCSQLSLHGSDETHFIEFFSLSAYRLLD
jgi:hypothetical protein